MLRPMLVALQFLTVIPVRFSQAPTVAEHGRSLLWYPFIGLGIGGLLALVAMAVHHVAPGRPLLQAAIVLAAWVVVTGGLHLDGLADCADAWIGGRGERERTLALLKDPACGAMAVIALNVVLLGKFAGLTTLLELQTFGTLVMVPTLGRTILLPLFVATPYVRAGGLGSALAEHTKASEAKLLTALCAVVVVLTLRGTGTLLLIVAVLATLWIRTLAQRRLGGITGDVAGATVELVEAAVLMTGALVPTGL